MFGSEGEEGGFRTGAGSIALVVLVGEGAGRAGGVFGEIVSYIAGLTGGRGETAATLAIPACTYTLAALGEGTVAMETVLAEESSIVVGIASSAVGERVAR